MKDMTKMEQARIRKLVRQGRDAALRIEKNLRGVEERIQQRRNRAA